ncbi:hypothetical protein ASG12_18410 [Williamsia sp. Leaf354]|jgi:predicted alpha/beta hydrolase|uniref:alpha/beta hydrolase family protein n=1 Tax=Williamsia sp. Leaf354 TaxID=1736349 RepID=UPI000701B45B|nr:alpha/beta fold hydrolase [Williamsia sp. Leaf354]KQR96181.1 hypothetical protein ASG12_18410 [Williamsia sp. Leaf354]
MTAVPIEITCDDGFVLHGHHWPASDTSVARPGVAIITAATGVLARYYHRYAAFLAGAGFDVVTFDYRGIGDSRPNRLRGMRCRWQDWGRKDLDAVLGEAGRRWPGAPISVVGHSVGGVVPLWAPRNTDIARVLSVGGQYAWRGDFAPWARRRLIWRWRVVGPLLTLACGYFPARRLGWMEDLPRGVAMECARRRPRMEDNYPRAERADVVAVAAALTAPVLAVATTDDEYATPAAVLRVLDYLPAAPHEFVQLSPDALGRSAIGHFGLFHSRHRDDFWADSLRWLLDGENPWPQHVWSQHVR